MTGASMRAIAFLYPSILTVLALDHAVKLPPVALSRRLDELLVTTHPTAGS